MGGSVIKVLTYINNNIIIEGTGALLYGKEVQ